MFNLTILLLQVYVELIYIWLQKFIRKKGIVSQLIFGLALLYYIIFTIEINTLFIMALNKII